MKKFVVMMGAVVVFVIVSVMYLEAAHPRLKSAGSAGYEEDETVAAAGSIVARLPNVDLDKVPINAPVIHHCARRDGCRMSIILDENALASNDRERMIETTLIDSVEFKFPPGGRMPGPEDVAWHERPKKMVAICSRERPTVIRLFGNGDWLADRLNIGGKIELSSLYNSRVYQAVCHSAFADEVANDPTQYGYAPAPEGRIGMFGVTSPNSYFKEG